MSLKNRNIIDFIAAYRMAAYSQLAQLLDC